jgi:hypothetical protein
VRDVVRIKVFGAPVEVRAICNQEFEMVEAGAEFAELVSGALAVVHEA